MTYLDWSYLFNEYGKILKRYPKKDAKYEEDFDDMGVLKTSNDEDNNNEPEEFEGMIFHLTRDDLQYTEPGTYSVQDKKIYCKIGLKNGDKIEDADGSVYTVQEEKDLRFSADIAIYIARRAD